ncbi:unnamed protein product [Ectocarpus sp. 13 AM-2016]
MYSVFSINSGILTNQNKNQIRVPPSNFAERTGRFFGPEFRRFATPNSSFHETSTPGFKFLPEVAASHETHVIVCFAHFRFSRSFFAAISPTPLSPPERAHSQGILSR